MCFAIFVGLAVLTAWCRCVASPHFERGWRIVCRSAPASRFPPTTVSIATESFLVLSGIGSSTDVSIAPTITALSLLLSGRGCHRLRPSENYLKYRASDIRKERACLQRRYLCAVAVLDRCVINGLRVSLFPQCNALSTSRLPASRPFSTTFSPTENHLDLPTISCRKALA
ncbi:hypothetical protein BJX70DRAFT_224749 [Aspergillus crustosus]